MADVREWRFVSGPPPAWEALSRALVTPPLPGGLTALGYVAGIEQTVKVQGGRSAWQIWTHDGEGMPRFAIFVPMPMGHTVVWCYHTPDLLEWLRLYGELPAIVMSADTP